MAMFMQIDVEPTMCTHASEGRKSQQPPANKLINSGPSADLLYMTQMLRSMPFKY